MQQRQVTPERRHDANARVIVSESDMDMHAANDQPAHCLLVGHGELCVTPTDRDDLSAPSRKWMDRSRDGSCAMTLGCIDHRRASLGQCLAHFGDAAADCCSGLKLRAQELRRYLVLPSLSGAFVEDGLIWLCYQIARLGVYEKELFLDAERDV